MIKELDNKSKLRKQLIQARLDLDSEAYASKSNFIVSKLKQHPDFIRAKTIGIYISFRQEVATISLIKEMFGKKNICVPKIMNKQMEFYYINSFNELKKNKFGILEPDKDDLVSKKEIDLLVVPMVGYDRNHNRLGYGGGYYDRYLSNYQGAVIGLAFSLQEVIDLPVEPFDLPIKTIINEK